MKTMLRKVSSFLLSVILICALLPVRAVAVYEIPGICQARTDTGAVCDVKTLDYEYENNTYISLRDMAMALQDTEKAFSLEIARDSVALNLGNAYVPVGVENVPWEEGEAPNLSLRQNEFKINGQEVKYYTMIMGLPSGYYDCFMMISDLAMILDVDITVSAADTLEIHTQEPFRVSPAALEQAGYFYGVNSVLAGDATTGEIYYQYQSDTPYPIASTSKLMTCLLAMDALYGGQLVPEGKIVISHGMEALSVSGDGVIPLKAGEEISVQDLLVGALLPSSNECALGLAEAIAGSEEAFVGRMNQKAQELGLSQAAFFNCNGLPVYTEDSVPGKLQNRMSAEDMFRLVSYLLKVYPQVTDITSMKRAGLESIGIEVRNTNPLLYNLPEATGLKTGTTNKAGACLVTSLAVDDGNEQHNLVVVAFGTENSIERVRVSELLARYALQVFDTGMEEPEGEGSDRSPGTLPKHAEAAVEWILRTAGSKR